MLVWFVVFYLLLSVAIGLYAATRVHNTKDFVVAGRHLPLPVVTATVFATWFGAETVLGISATFVKEGLGGVVADPFGSSLCLILAGLFFARRLYRLNLLTIGDYYRLRYNRTIEVVCTLAIVGSYLGWVSAQIKALGLVFNVVTAGAISQPEGMIIGAAIVLTYTTFGGMLSVAVLDFVQMIVIMAGMLFIGWIVSGMTGGVGAVVGQASAAGKLNLFPEASAAAWIPFIGAWVTMMLGSIPQQDVFQRITSAKDEKTAVRGSVLGGSIYFFFAFVPMFLAFSATLIDPAMFGSLLEKDSQLVLPTLILSHTPLFAQVVFFGALLSAIMSCSAATLLAPSVTFSENVIRNAVPRMTDRTFLWTMRATLVVFALIVLVNALISNESIFKMVENAYKVTLVTAFVPLAAGLYWKRANTQGALFAVTAGAGAWLVLELLQPATVWPPQLLGLFAAIAGMGLGSLLPHFVGRPTPIAPAHAELHRHAAAQTHHVPAHPHHPAGGRPH
ncbi:MAG: sodium:solute symporter family protein [Burkholderiales bacterium]|nr:sodium:solute symporter family protein [Burkholderiales bacterium]